MNKTLIAIVIFIVIVVGGVFLFNNKSKAPVVGEEQAYTTPSPGESVNVDVNVNVGQVKEFVVEGKNFSFTPSTITVKKGDKVKIIFKNSAGFHDFVIDEYGAATKQTQAPTTEVLEFTANKTGSFEYYCSVGMHRAMGMKGTLIVN